MREIVTYPDPILRTKCPMIKSGPYFDDIENLPEDPEERAKLLKFGWVDDAGKPISKYITDLVDHMKKTLLATQYGIGLAAPQVGVNLRLFIMCLDRNVDPIVVLNPTYSEPRGGDLTDIEGCLSLPGLEGKVTRPSSVLITGSYLNGDSFSFRAEPSEKDKNSVISRVCQHEIDHLDGILFFERMSGTARRKFEMELEEVGRQNKRWADRLARKEKK